MKLLRKLRTFSALFRNRPSEAIDILSIRIEQSLGVSLFFLSPSRIATYLFELFTTKPLSGPGGSGLEAYGNYYLVADRIGPKPVIFSVGIGQHVDFDKAVLDRHDVRLFMFDPIPSSKRYVDSLGWPANAQFTQLAITDHDGTVDLFVDALEGDLENASSSTINRSAGSKAFTVTSRRIKTLMEERGLTHLDVLKMDIEGAALKALRDVLKDGIRPTQIACELERPGDPRAVYGYLKEVAELFSTLKAEGYEIFRTRDTTKGFQIEIVAVRSKDAQGGSARGDSGRGRSTSNSKNAAHAAG